VESKPKKTKSFVMGAAVLGIAGLLAKIIGAVYRIPLASILQNEGMSLYEIAYPYYSWLLVISSAGLPTAISKMVSERITKGDYSGAKKVFRVAFQMLVIIGIATAAIMFLLSGALASLSGLKDARLSFIALSPALFFVSIMCAYRGYLQGMQHMGGTALSQIIEQVIKLLFGFTLARALMPRGVEYAAMGALLGVSISEAIALLAIIWYYNIKKAQISREQKQTDKFKPERRKSIVQSLLILAIPITVGASIMPLTGIADSALIINTLTKTGFTLEVAKGYYAILRSNVTVLINMPAVLTVALAMSLVPAISGARAKRDIRGVVAASKTGLKLSLIIGLPCAVGLFLLGRPIIAMLFSYLTPEQLDVAESLMRTAAIGVLFLSVVQAVTGVLQGLNRPLVPVINLFLGGVLKVITMIILMRIPSINIQGAAISTVACYALAATLDVWVLTRVTRMKIDIYDMFIKPILASLFMGIFVYAAYRVLTQAGHGMLATLASVAVGVVVYGACVVAFRLFSKADLEFIPGGRKLRRLMYRDDD
jgi:stage V sporulation protein B